MYSDGDRKTVSELQREAEMTRNQIVEEARQLERIKRITAKTQFSIDQLFRFFAREVETEEERKTLIDILLSNAPDIHMETVPLLPIATAIANGRLSNARRIYASDNHFVEDNSLIYLVHVLRFCPQAAQIEYLDISNTRVTEKGMTFALEMMVERSSPFTLVCKGLVFLRGIAAGNTDDSDYKARVETLLQLANSKRHCAVETE